MLRKKILHVTQFLGVGGLEKILFILINEQMKSGHVVDLVVYDYEQSWVEYFRSQGINVISDFRKKEGYDINLLNYLSSRVTGYDVVHTHDLNPLMYAAPLKVMFSLRGKKFPRLIHTAHGMDHLKQRPRARIYEKLCSFSADLTVGVSPAVMNTYRRDLLVPAHKVINIDNGTSFDNPAISRAEARLKIKNQFAIHNDKPIWVYVARLVPLKNHELIIEACRENENFNMLFIGPSGDESHTERLKSISPKNVLIVGGQSNINEILSGADFYISSSTHEGIPVSVLEAGAMKLPCLLSDIPGHRLMGENAHYFSLSSVDELKMKMNVFMEDPDLTKALANNLHQKVLHSYSAKAMSEKYIAAYEGLT